jgi:hypothetical protein
LFAKEDKKLRIRVVSNFLIPHLEEESFVIEDGSAVRHLLESLSKLSGESFVFFERGKNTLDPDDWEVAVNGIAFDGFQIGAETLLKDNDVVEIRLLMYSGG